MKFSSTAGVIAGRKQRAGDIHQCVADPVAGQQGRILHFADSRADAIDMGTSARGEGDGPVVEDKDVELGGGRVALNPGIGDQDTEGDEVVGSKDLDLLAGLAQGHVLGCQRVDVEGVGHGVHVLLGRVVHVQPPGIAARLAFLLG